MASSASPDEQKMSILTQEVIRRMRHISRDAPQEERDLIIDEFCETMRMSGYKEGTIREVMIRGLKGYERQVAQSVKEGRISIHKKGSSTRQARQIKKITGKTQWYKKRPREEDETEATLKQSPRKKIKMKKENADN